MKEQWQQYSQRYLAISPREQYLILATGLIVIALVAYSFFIEDNQIKTEKNQQQISRLEQTNTSNALMINELETALKGDLNKGLKKQISQYEAKLAKVDKNLLALTSDLISPVQMRNALLQLLNLQKGVSLQSFELAGAETVFTAKTNDDVEQQTPVETAVLEEEVSANLYRHGIKIKLKGSYFQLHNYLQQLEQLSWKFFWHGFNYQVQEYPNSELEIEIYSLSTKKEFIGV